MYSRYFQAEQLSMKDLHCRKCAGRNALVDLHPEYLSTILKAPVMTRLLLDLAKGQSGILLGNSQGVSPGAYLKLITGKGKHSGG